MINILFDFDGTLFNTDEAHENAYKRVFLENNIKPSHTYEEIKGIKTVDIFRRYADEEKSYDLARKKTETYLNSLDQIEAFVDFNLLKQCKNQGNRLFIVSGGSRISIHSLLELHNIFDLFDGIITAGDYMKSKPDPEPFQTCISRFNISGNVVGVEDSVAGITSLKKAHITAIGVHNNAIKDISDYFYQTINMFIQNYILHEK
ncbi:MAG: HAD family phosphatase [Candidatus Paceibacterota bacterium]